MAEREQGAVVHHVAVVTRDGDEVARFLTEVCGMTGETPVYDGGDAHSRGLVAALAGCTPDEAGPARASLIGTGRAGIVELFDWPDGPGAPEPGLLLLSFTVKDLEPILAACRRLGVDCEGPFRAMAGNLAVNCFFARVGGLTFEFVSLARDNDDEPVPMAAGPSRGRS